MAKSKRGSKQSRSPYSDFTKEVAATLAKGPPEWSRIVASRAALRVLPLAHSAENLETNILLTFGAAAIAHFASTSSTEGIRETAAEICSIAIGGVDTDNFAGFASSLAAQSLYADPTKAAETAVMNALAASNVNFAEAGIASAIGADAKELSSGLAATQLSLTKLWWSDMPAEIANAWRARRLELADMGPHWSVWIDWYDYILRGGPKDEAYELAFTSIPGPLAWDGGAAAVNAEISSRLMQLARNQGSSVIPNQSPAPVRVEERGGKIAMTTNRDSALGAAERDFQDWRDPVVDHIGELTRLDFATGTNHSRVRERLLALDRLLPGEIAEVKDRQFRIGYEIERFDRLLIAYREGGEDMPALNAAQLEDLNHLRIALRMGIDKLERWSEFRKQAGESATGEADADGQTVGEALNEMAAAMEQSLQYFDPELPATFRFLADAVRDPLGATKTIVYGAVKSAENLLSFLGQKALDIGKKGSEAVEAHISKAVAASLVTGLGAAALSLSSALPQSWAWLKPLLAALGIGG